MVVNFLKVMCCGKWYYNPVDLEEHKLTIPHLKRHHINLTKMKEADAKDKEAGITGDEILEEDVKEENNEHSGENGEEKDAKESKMEDEEVPEDEKIEPYNPNEVFATEYMKKIMRVQCSACWQWLYPTESLKELHCRSHSHYNKVVAIRRAKQERRKKLKEEAERKAAAEAAGTEAVESKEEKVEKDEDDDDAGSDVTLEDLEHFEGDVIGEDTAEGMEADDGEDGQMEVEENDEEKKEEEEKPASPEPEPEEPAPKTRRGRGRGRGRAKR